MTNLEVAETIRQQVGSRALFMLGAKDLTAGSAERYLQFKIGRNSKGATHVRITLDPSDTYTVTAYRIRCKKGEIMPTVTTLESCEHVYVDCLHRVLESLTGMHTSL